MNYPQTYVLNNSSSFPSEKLPLLQQELAGLDDSALNALMMVPLKNPLVALLLAIFFGELGVDRFYVGNKELGFLKLAAMGITFVLMFVLIGFLLLPLIYLWKLIDCFLIMNACKEANYQRLMKQIYEFKAFQEGPHT
ncbi:TPA: TM2 domain-containing protein [Streptococcus suis]